MAETRGIGIKVYAGLDGAKPTEVGEIEIPVSVKGSTVEANVAQAMQTLVTAIEQAASGVTLCNFWLCQIVGHKSLYLTDQVPSPRLVCYRSGKDIG